MKKLVVSLVLVLCFAGLIYAEDLRLDIMSTNDMHGGIDRSQATFINPSFPPQLGGGGSAATLIKYIRSFSNDKRTSLLLDAGDFFQGRPVGTVTNGTAVIEYMNDIGYDAMTIGNHEFDVNGETLEKTLEMADFPIITCNIIDKRTGEIPWFARPYIIMNKMGLKIGIVGVTTTDTEKMSFPENIKNTKYVKILREQEKVDLVIVLAHAGLPYDPIAGYKSRYDDQGNPKFEQRTSNWGYDTQELAREIEGIDLIIGGHMHKGFGEPWIDPVTHTIVVQGYAYGSGLGWMTLTIDPQTKTISGIEKPAIREGVLVTLFEDQFIPDAVIGPKIAAQVAIAEKGMDEVIGNTAVYLSRVNVDAQSLMGNTVVDAMRNFTGSDFAFINLGGIRSDIKQGPVTYRNVFDVMPFDNMVISFNCSGEFLKRIIETRVADTRAGLIVSGVNVVYTKKRKNFDRVTDLRIGGKLWDPKKIYKVTTTDFLMQGNAGLTLLTQVPEEDVIYHQANLRDAIVHYFKNKSPIRTKIDNRWERNDNSEPTSEMIKAMQ
jgi:2',3'-cyclic-nucleotide 2'-phosphodiesterase (5'-nucleotidase family)